MGRILSIDYGLKRIGLALSDPLKIIASAYGQIEAAATLEQTIDALLLKISSLDIEEIIIGYPLHMNGTQGELATHVQRFVELLRTKVSSPIRLWDERLSSQQAKRVFDEANISRKKWSKVIDTVVAVILLQSYLETKTIENNSKDTYLSK